jgi:predicted DNA-binding protein
MDTDSKESSTLTVRMEEELLHRFKVACVKKDRPMSDVVRKFIGWYVEREEEGTGATFEK